MMKQQISEGSMSRIVNLSPHIEYSCRNSAQMTSQTTAIQRWIVGQEDLKLTWHLTCLPSPAVPGLLAIGWQILQQLPVGLLAGRNVLNLHECLMIVRDCRPDTSIPIFMSVNISSLCAPVGLL